MLVAERNCSSDEFWLFLTRLRLDLFERDLAFRTSSVRWKLLHGPIFCIWCWDTYPYGPPKKKLSSIYLKLFENIIRVVDCTKIKCQTPQDLGKQSKLYSDYKSHNTFKGLVGISPNVWPRLNLSVDTNNVWKCDSMLTFCKFCLNISTDSTPRLTYWDTRPSAFFLGYRMHAGGLKVSVTSHDYVVQSFPPPKFSISQVWRYICGCQLVELYFVLDISSS